MTINGGEVIGFRGGGETFKKISNTITSLFLG
jgi:hypothetical protein